MRPMLHSLFTPLVILLAAAPVFGQDLLPPDRPMPEVIDHYVEAALAEDGDTAAPRASDATLVRRVYLDLTGRIPAPAETRAFVESDDPQKFEKLVDELLASPEFVEQMATEFDTWMMDGNGSIKGYLTDVFRENRPWDQVFREVIEPDQTDEQQKRAAEFLKRRVSDTDKLTNDVSVAFFGINVSCAKCHDHPLVADWTQSHFYGMKSFFNRTFDNGGFLAEREYGDVEFKTTEGETKQASLMFLSGKVIDEPKVEPPSKEEKKAEKKRLEKFKKEKKPLPPPEFSRRSQLVDVALEEGENVFFARNLANRVWHQFVGYGLVMPLDQMHSSNPPSHPDLMQWLARDTIEHGYDVKRIVRGVVLSDVYARSSRWEGEDRPNEWTFAVANVRPLTPTQMARSLNLARNDPDQFEGDLKPEERAKRIRSAAGTGNSNWFEQPTTDFAISADEALLFTNSENFANNYLKSGLFNHLKEIEDDGELVDAAYRSILVRLPTDNEREALVKYLAARKDRREAGIRQVMWALLAGTEFRFNH